MHRVPALSPGSPRTRARAEPCAYIKRPDQSASLACQSHIQDAAATHLQPLQAMGQRCRPASTLQAKAPLPSGTPGVDCRKTAAARPAKKSNLRLTASEAGGHPGMLLRSLRDPVRLEQWLAHHELKAYARLTIASKERMRIELTRVRAESWALSTRQQALDARGLPLCGTTGSATSLARCA